MKNIITICLLILCTAIQLRAQQYNQTTQFRKANSQWAFGKKAGLNFNSGSPVPIVTNYGTPISWEGGASVANRYTGAMEFYSSGYDCKNRNGNVMPHGSGLKGNDSSTTQGVCIVPFVGDSTKYYLFSLSGPTDRPDTLGQLFYSVVDMKLDGGLGDIDTNQKNVLLFRYGNGLLGEAMIAVPGNNCDIWLLVHYWQTSKVRSYHITASGIDTTTIISNVGTTLQGFSAYYVGGMAISPDRSMLAICSSGDGITTTNSGNELAKFDPNTGVVSNGLALGPFAMTSYSTTFSPDGTKVYFSNQYPTNALPFSNADLSQYTIGSNWNAASITATRQVIRQASVNLRTYGDTIYASPLWAGSSNINTVGYITQPNLAGTACDYQPFAITLAPGTRTIAMLPNEVVFANCGAVPPVPPIVTIDTIPGTVRDTALCSTNGIFPTMVLTAKAGSKYIWDDGSMQQTRTISNTGIYWVRYYVNDSVVTTDSFRLQEAPPLPSFSLGPDAVICESKSQPLTAPAGNYSYRWQDNSTNRTYEARKKGIYFVTISQNGCTAADTVIVDTKNCSCTAAMPTAFTPNNDGRNDRIVPLFGNDCQPLGGYTFRIFNRWGQLVYVSYSLKDKGWDGMFNGQPAEVGTYFYELNYNVTNLKENRHQTGDVTLVR